MSNTFSISLKPIDLFYTLLTYSDTLFHSNPTERYINSSSYVKIKETKIYFNGQVRIKFSIRTSTSASLVYGKVYINDVEQGVEHSTDSEIYVSFSDDLTVSTGDLIQIYIHRGPMASTQYCKDLNICGEPSVSAISIT